MSNQEAMIAIVIMAVVTAAIRFAPFLIFAGKETPQIITKLGKELPYAIMGMLVVYCLKNVNFGHMSQFVPELIASLVVVLTYVWKKNTLLSIISGTACYMIFVQMIFV